MTVPKPPRPVGITDRPETRAPVVVRSEDLLGGQREILIIHGQEVYRLRLTRNGKLILMK
ncbi:MAG: hemin uptake protein HemP [Deltaproteobacteria bacterium]